VGFVAVLLTNAALVAFLAWGFQQPPLDRVWELHHELKIGALGKLGSDDRALLHATMARYPALASALFSQGEVIGLLSANSQGWLETPDATILRSPLAGRSCSMVLDVKIPDHALPLKIDVEGLRWHRHLDIAHQGSSRLLLPELENGPEIITLAVASKASRDEVATLGLRVRFECAEKREPGKHD
jgi:hypothetical protein